MNLKSATKQVMNVGILAMFLLDTGLTAIAINNHRSAVPPKTQQPVVQIESTAPSSVAPVAGPEASAIEVTSAIKLLRQDGDLTSEVYNATGGARPYTSPPADASKWDYSGGTSTAQNWANWASTSSGSIQLSNESYSYQNPYRQVAIQSKR